MKEFMSAWIRTVATLGLAIGLAGAATAQGETKTENGLNAGLSLTEGNSETLSANVSLTLAGEKEGFGSYRSGAEGNYGESTVDEATRRTVGNGKAYGNVRRTLSERMFVSLDGVALFDEVAEIDYRITLGPGLGVYLLKNDRLILSLEAGPSYVWEDVGGLPNNYLAMRLAQRLDVRLSPTAKLWESVEVLPDSSDFGSYLITGEIGLEASVTERVVLRVVLQDKFDSEPAAGLEKNDLALISGLGVRF